MEGVTLFIYYQVACKMIKADTQGTSGMLTCESD